MNNFEIKFELDCRGLKCPMPIIKTRNAIGNLKSGEILKMMATDPGSINDIKSWANRTGNELIKEEHHAGEFIFFICKQ